jgi:hypothetical protein
MFRKLKASEIDVRVQSVKEGKGAVLLLYKDARCDMNILDETVGALNWQREHKLIGDVMYCGISIWDADKGQWITKWDAGVESNMEAAKGASSDSFKRSAFNFGIGRELYTSPFIWVNATNFNKYDKFIVEKIVYDDEGISALSIKNGEGKRVFVWQKKDGKDNE